MFNWLRNITAGGDVVGRDKITNILPASTQMDLLSQKYVEEKSNQQVTYVIIDELTHYSNENYDIRDLTEKLEDAGFGYLVDVGEELKEEVSKLIIRNQHYKSAQKIITFLLAEVESIFNANIKKRLLDVKEEAALKLLFRTHLEKEIQAHLGDNVLEIFNRQINGMVYFLTGNCHLEWK
ncbi:MAG: ABC-three component system protein [Pseudomonadota bacterium]|nr:ABC-three component system protein [Pseudomonadota bacterium]